MAEIKQFPGYVPKKNTSGGGGGNMEAIIAKLESDVSEIKVDLAKVATQIETRFPEFVTKADIADIRTEISNLKDKVGNRVIALDGKIDDRFTALTGKADTDFSTLNGKIDITQTSLDAKIDTSFAAIDAKIDTGIASVRTKIADTKSELIKWMIGTMLAGSGLAATIAFGLAKLLQ